MIPSRNAIRLLFIFGFCLFGEARGQFIANGGQWPESVQFRTDVPGGRLYIEENRLTFDLYDRETTNAVFAAHGGNVPAIPVPEKLRCHAYQVVFEGANVQSRPFGKKPLGTRYSFFLGNDPDQWGSDLSAYNEIHQSEIYPGIDLKIYRKSELKYDLIVKPHGDVANIRLAYDGVKPHLNKAGELSLKTSVGEVIESKPFAYQVINGAIKEVQCAYRIQQNKVGFDIGEYNRDYDLIIDPELVFSTYSGSFSDNFGYTATYDAEGHLYAGSSSFGTGYPVTIGAYQTTWAGGGNNGAGTDIALSKFSLDGTGLIYSTYLGGSRDELPHSIITGEDGSLYLLGTTGSNNFPVTQGAFQTTFQGGTQTTFVGIGIQYTNGSDIVICRLGPTGTNLLASTYMGGTGNDGINTNSSLKFNYADEVRGEIELDTEGNILVGSSTFSTNFPVVEGNYQTTKNAGQEGVLFKLNNMATSLLASTFFGGSGADAIYSINTVENGTVMIAGGTTSEDLSVPEGAYQPTYGGGRSDGFVATLNSDFTSLENATYFGSATYDQIYFVERDEENFPHIYGQTNAPGNTFIVNAAYNVPNSGMLLAKLNPNLTNLEWSTVFGNGNTTPNLSPTAFSVDICNRIYLSGWGGQVGGGEQGLTTGLAVTPDAIKSTTNGGDFYFMVLASDASELTFASFFGGNQSNEHVDGGTSRFDRAGKIYQAVCAGCTNNNDFPIEPANALSPTNNSFNCNLGVAKIDFDLPLIIADFQYNAVCLPDAVFFTNTSETQGGTNPFFQWDFGDGSASGLQNPTHVYQSPGTYEVTLILTDPLACNVSDTLTQTVQILPELTLILPDTLQSCEVLALSVTADTEGTASLFTWAADPEFNNILLSGVSDSVFTYSGNPGYVYIKASNDLCEATDSIFVVPAPNFALSLPDTLLCSEQELFISAMILNGHTIDSLIWSPDEVIISGQGTEEISIDATVPINISVTGMSNFGCQLSEMVQIDVYPISLTASNDTLICDDEPILLVANSGGRATNFLWSSTSAFNDQLNVPGDSTLLVFPNALTYYFIQVENNGCFLTDSVAVSQLSAGTTVAADQFICAGDTANLFVSNDFPGNTITHIWSPEEDIISGQGTGFAQSIVTETTTFSVTSTTGDGCIVENSTTIFTSPLGNDTLSAQAIPQFITIGSSSLISVMPQNSLYNYQWTPSTWLENSSSPNTTSTPDETITYYVTISDFDTRGVCAKSDSVTIFVYEVICGTPNIFVPNAFTPNSDGENDVVFVRGGGVTDLEFSIFDRWGNLLFKTTDQTQGWDGTYKDNLAEPAVYVYYLEVTCGDGQTFSDKGNITLIR